MQPSEIHDYFPYPWAKWTYCKDHKVVGCRECSCWYKDLQPAPCLSARELCEWCHLIKQVSRQTFANGKDACTYMLCENCVLTKYLSHRQRDDGYWEVAVYDRDRERINDVGYDK